MTNVSETSIDEPIGIAGWLLFALIGFVIQIGATVWWLIQTIRDNDLLHFLFDDNSGEFFVLKIAIGTTIITGIIVGVGAMTCVFLIYTKKRAAVHAAIFTLIAQLVGSATSVWEYNEFVEAFPSMSADYSYAINLAGAVIDACIWVPYFLVSKRVRNTLV
jgi:Protein of unknown function (DUF2569)